MHTDLTVPKPTLTPTPTPTATPTSTPTPTPTPTPTSTPTPTPTPTQSFTPTPEGQARHIVDEFEIWLPDSWQSWEITPETTELIVETLRETMPDWAEEAELLLESTGAGASRFFAFDTESREYLTNLNVMSDRLPVPVPLDMLIEALAESYTELGLEVASTQSDLKINGLTAGVILVDMPFQAPEGRELIVSILQYIILDGDIFYVLTFTTDVNQIADYTPIFESIARSFRIQK